jgi:hypothetical protein
MSNTLTNIGLRKQFAGLGDRNFEHDGTVQYKALREPFNFRGTIYHTGDLIPFDGAGVYTSQGVSELLRAWDQEWIQPTV